jgi:hypothetical protein
VLLFLQLKKVIDRMEMINIFFILSKINDCLMLSATNPDFYYCKYAAIFNRRIYSIWIDFETKPCCYICCKLKYENEVRLFNTDFMQFVGSGSVSTA